MGAFNASLTLYKGYVGDANYQNVFYIESASQYKSFLDANFNPLAFNADMYIIRDGKVRVNHGTFDQLRKYNYLTYTNFTDLANPTTYFAFITDVKYINDSCTEISFDIDLWSTYISQITLKDGLIERAHTASDDLFEHTLPEPVNSDAIITRDIVRSGYMGAWSLVLLNTFKINGTATDDVYLDMINGSLMPLYPLVFNIITDVNPDTGITIDETELNYAVTILEDLIKVQGKIDGIHKAFLFPTSFINLANRNVEIKGLTLAAEPSDFVQGNDSYTPKNNKMYCYPYNYCEIDNGSESLQIRYDIIKNQNVAVNFYSSLSPAPSIMCKLNSTHIGYTYLDNLTLSNFPSIMLDKSILNEYIKNGGNIEASNLMYSMLNTALSGVSAGFAYGTGSASGASTATSAISGALGTVQSITNWDMKMQNIKRKGDSVIGSYNVTIANALGLTDFHFKHNQLKPEAARTIDNYFTRYGYTLNKIATPNLIARAYYTYLRVHDLEMTGNITQQAKTSIKAMFDRGITVWRPSAVTRFGDYSYNPTY